MPIIPSIVNWLNAKRLNNIELFKKYPVETQQETLYRLLAKSASTEWGKKYGYSSIKSISDYQSRFHIQTYEDLLPYVDRLRRGEANLLWPGEIRWFAKSSGTTSTKSKFRTKLVQLRKICTKSAVRAARLPMNQPSKTKLARANGAVQIRIER